MERTSVQQDTCKVGLLGFEHPSRPKCEELPSLEFYTVLKARASQATPPNRATKHHIGHHVLRSSCVREHICWPPHTERHTTKHCMQLEDGAKRVDSFYTAMGRPVCFTHLWR